MSWRKDVLLDSQTHTNKLFPIWSSTNKNDVSFIGNPNPLFNPFCLFVYERDNSLFTKLLESSESGVKGLSLYFTNERIPVPILTLQWICLLLPLGLWSPSTWTAWTAIQVQVQQVATASSGTNSNTLLLLLLLLRPSSRRIPSEKSTKVPTIIPLIHRASSQTTKCFRSTWRSQQPTIILLIIIQVMDQTTPVIGVMESKVTHRASFHPLSTVTWTTTVGKMSLSHPRCQTCELVGTTWVTSLMEKRKKVVKLLLLK